MNKNTLIGLFTTLLILSGLNSLNAQSQLTVSVQNIKKKVGTIRIGLFNNAKHFPQNGKPLRTAVVNVAGNAASTSFKNLPEGHYAVAVYHDENNDNKCNTLMGIPTEAYGFSKNFKPKFSPPDFNDTKIEVKGNKNLVINLIH